MYATLEGGKFTGDVYLEMTPHLQAWHDRHRLSYVIVSINPSAGKEPTLEQVRASQLYKINIAFANAASSLTDGYPDAERMTWTIQQKEAMAWADDPGVPTPYLDGVAAARNIDPVQMRHKALQQTQLFMQASQQLIGTRQRLRDAIYLASTCDDVMQVKWPSNLNLDG